MVLQTINANNNNFMISIIITHIQIDTRGYQQRLLHGAITWGYQQRHYMGISTEALHGDINRGYYTGV